MGVLSELKKPAAVSTAILESTYASAEASYNEALLNGDAKAIAAAKKAHDEAAQAYDLARRRDAAQQARQRDHETQAKADALREARELCDRLDAQDYEMAAKVDAWMQEGAALLRGKHSTTEARLAAHALRHGLEKKAGIERTDDRTTETQVCNLRFWGLLGWHLRFWPGVRPAFYLPDQANWARYHRGAPVEEKKD